MRVGEGLKTFGARNMMFDVRNMILGVKGKLHERVVVPMVTYVAERGV